MTVSSDFHPDYAVSPGETITDLLVEAEMTQTELARRLGVSLKHVNQVVKGSAPISAEFALGLERVLGPSVSYWMTREALYRADLVRLAEPESLKAHVAWAHEFPTDELVKRGFLDRASSGPELVRSLLSFLGVASPAQWEEPQVAYRKSQKLESDPKALSTWLRVGEAASARIDCEPFDPDKFRVVLQDVRALTLLPADEWHPRLVELCAGAGVAVVVVPAFKKARANGAARWPTPSKGLIQLSLRYRWEDVFWFSFFHEAGHLLLHRKKEVFGDFIDGAGATGGDSSEDGAKQEDEANRFASRTLIPSQYDRRLRALSISEVPEFAEQIGIHPGCVVGRLQHEGLLSYRVGHDLRAKLPDWLDDAKSEIL